MLVEWDTSRPQVKNVQFSWIPDTTVNGLHTKSVAETVSVTGRNELLPCRSRLLRQAIAQDADESVLDSSFTEGLCLCFESCNLLVHDLQQPYKSMRKETQNAILQALKQLNDSLHGIERALAMAAQHVGLANASEDDRHLWDVRPGFNWDKAKQTAELYIQKAVAAVTQVAADMQVRSKRTCFSAKLGLRMLAYACTTSSALNFIHCSSSPAACVRRIYLY